MRQLFDLYICLRPCKAYPGNPLNYKEGLDLVVFRENTEDLYSGVEFSPVPDELAATLKKLSKPFARLRALGGDDYAISCKINTSKGSERIVRAAFEFARKFGRKKVTVVHKANVVRATDGLFLDVAREVAKGLPGDRVRRGQHRRHDDVAAEEPVQLRRAGRAEPVRRRHLGPVRADGRRPRLRLLGQHRRQAGGVRADARLGAEVRRAVQGEPDRHDPHRQDDARLARRERRWRRASRAATAAVIAEGAVRTYDMGGSASTLDMAKAIVAKM